MGVFENASAVAPFRAGYLVLQGMGTGSNSRNGLDLLYGEVGIANELPKFQSTNFFDGQSSTSIVTQNGVYHGSVPYLFALDDSTIVALYAGEENGQTGIWAHVFFDDGATLTRVTALQQLAGDLDFIASAPIFGASTVPGLSGFLLAYNNADGMAYTWCSLPSYTPGQPMQLNVLRLSGSGDGTVNGNVSLVVVVNGAGGGEMPVQAIQTVNYGKHLDVSIYGLDVSDGVPVIDTANNMETDGQWDVFSLFRGADGLAWYQSTTGGSGTITLGVVASDGTLTPGAATNLPASSLPHPAPVYYTFGEFTANPPVGMRETVPVYRTLLFGADSGDPLQVGQAQRTVFQQEPPPTQQGVVIGIFDSGPPVPNENLAGLSPGATIGVTTFGEIDSQTTGWTINSSIGGFFQYQSSDGIPGILSVTQKFKISFGVTAAFSQQATSQQIKSYYAKAQTILDNNQLVTNPQGQALVGFTSFIGYRYVFLDTTGSPVPNAPPYYELYSTGWTINSLPYDYNPAATAGKVPGNILSYVMNDGEEQSLEQNLLNGASIAQAAWSTAGGANVQPASITQGSKSIGTNLNFQASIGGSLGPPGENISVSAGVQASFAINYTWSTTTTDQIQTSDDLGPLNDPPPAGAYSSYSYDVLILAHNQQYTAELISLLQSYPSTNNTTLLGLMAPNSSPWQIIHIVRAYELAGANAPAAARSAAAGR
jgi:hypothetical protein